MKFLNTFPKSGLSDTIVSGGNMDGDLTSYDQVWFGIREPEWYPEDEDVEDKILRKNETFRKAGPVKILRKS